MGLFLTGRGARPVDADEAAVRSTLEPVDKTAPPVEAPGPPQFGEVITDESAHNGLATRDVASDWVEGARRSPFWADQADRSQSYAMINGAQASAGTAASRELAGNIAPGLAYAQGIQPVIRDGGAFGADYFAVEAPGIQPTMGAEMTPAIGADRDEVVAARAAATAASRDAAAAGLYTAWFDQVVSR